MKQAGHGFGRPRPPVMGCIVAVDRHAPARRSIRCAPVRDRRQRRRRARHHHHSLRQSSFYVAPRERSPTRRRPPRSCGAAADSSRATSPSSPSTRARRPATAKCQLIEITDDTNLDGYTVDTRGRLQRASTPRRHRLSRRASTAASAPVFAGGNDLQPRAAAAPQRLEHPGQPGADAHRRFDPGDPADAGRRGRDQHQGRVRRRPNADGQIARRGMANAAPADWRQRPGDPGRGAGAQPPVRAHRRSGRERRARRHAERRQPYYFGDPSATRS